MVNTAGAPLGGGFAFTYLEIGNQASGFALDSGVSYICTPATTAKSYILPALNSTQPGTVIQIVNNGGSADCGGIPLAGDTMSVGAVTGQTTVHLISAGALTTYYSIGSTWMAVDSGAAAAASSSSYLYARRTSRQTTNLLFGDNLVFDNIEGSSGSDITLATGTGIFTLAASKTYRLSATTGCVFFNNTGLCEVQWYNITASAFFGNAMRAIPESSLSDGSNVSSVTAILTTGVSTTVELRILATTQHSSFGVATQTNPTANITVL